MTSISHLGSRTGQGQLEVIIGCMFSGKTEELIRRVERARIANQQTLIFKPSIDDRYDQNAVVTHYGRNFEAFLLDPGQEYLEILYRAVGEETIQATSVIAFDEGNLFEKSLPALCERLVAMDKRVIVAGLDLTFAGDPFEPMPTLMARADLLDKLHAVCVRCGGIATRTQRLVNGKPARSTDPVILIGGQDHYEARCRDCYEVPT
ncbi:MAG: thymidine kinase [Candidatus Bipolaricaulia bacterium]